MIPIGNAAVASHSIHELYRADVGFFIEFDRFQLLCLPVASSVLVVVAPGRAQLGVIRHKTQHLADALAEVLPE